jgi:plasmid stabilization system protein ParE
MAGKGRHRVDTGRLLGAEPRRDQPGRRRDWQQLRVALERLADHDRGDRHRPQERPGRLQSRDLGRQERHGR